MCALARKPFVIIDAEILSSSIWSEAIHVRVVWFTMLVLCDTEGYVGAAVPGIARAAGVTLEQTQDAIERLKSPDPHSRTKTDEGRRIREVERGFLVLNFKEHLARLSRERAMSRERVRRYREKKRHVTPVTPGNVSVTAGKREQGIGNRDEDRRTEEPPALLPADVQGEKLLRQSRVAKERRFYALIKRLSELQPEKDPPDIAREVTCYTTKDGRKVGGIVRPENISEERLDKSLEDAEWWIAELERKNGQAGPGSVQRQS